MRWQGQNDSKHFYKSNLLLLTRLAFSIVGIIAASYGQMLLDAANAPTPDLTPGLAGFCWLLAGMCMVAISILGWRPPTSQPVEWRPSLLMDGLLVMLILFCTVLLRCYDLIGIPYGVFVDETEIAINALDVFTGSNNQSFFGTSWYGVSSLYMYTQAAFFKIFGITLWGLRFSAVVWGTSTVIVFYFLVRYLYGASWAFLGAMLLATSRWHINLSRSGFVLIQAAMFLVLILSVFIHSIRLKPFGPAEDWFQPQPLSSWRRLGLMFGLTLAYTGLWWFGLHRLERDWLPWHSWVIVALVVPSYFLTLRVLRWPSDARTLEFLCWGALLGLSLYSYLPTRLFVLLMMVGLLHLTLAGSSAPLWLRRFTYASWAGVLIIGCIALEAWFGAHSWPLWPILGSMGFLGVLAVGGTVVVGGFYPGFLRRFGSQIILAWIVAFVIFAPLLFNYLAYPVGFIGRTNEVRIDRLLEEQHSSWPLWQGEIRHLTMFNFKGSDLARHNIPFLPMVDPLLGVMMALGFAVALACWWQPFHGLVLIWVLVGLQAGALTRPVDAAHAIRVTHVLPGAILLAIIFLSKCMSMIRVFLASSRLRQGALRIATGMIIAVVAIVCIRDPYLYFTRQVNVAIDEYTHTCGAHTTIAYRVRDLLSENVRVYLTEEFHGFSSIRFLNWPDFRMHLFSLQESVPFPLDVGHDVVVIVPLDKKHIAEQLSGFYPHVKTIAITHPPVQSGPVAWEIRIPSTDIEAIYGVEVVYQLTGDGVQPLEERMTVPNFQVLWSQELEQKFASRLNVLSLPANVSRRINCRSMVRIDGKGTYAFIPNVQKGSILSPGDFYYRVDRTIIASHPERMELLLFPGNHLIELQIKVPGPEGGFSLDWQAPGAANHSPIPHELLSISRASPTQGMTGYYYLNEKGNGNPIMVRDDHSFEVYPPILQEGTYSIVWRGRLAIEQAGLYKFSVSADDGSKLFISGQQIVEYTPASPSGEIELMPGLYPIELRYWNLGGSHSFRFQWQPPGKPAEFMPDAVLQPEPFSWETVSP